MINYDKLKEILDAAPTCDPERKKDKGIITKEIRIQILDRDKNICVVCENKKENTIIHHKDPYGAATLENLVSLDLTCHEYIHKILRKKGYKYYRPPAYRSGWI